MITYAQITGTGIGNTADNTTVCPNTTYTYQTPAFDCQCTNPVYYKWEIDPLSGTGGTITSFPTADYGLTSINVKWNDQGNKQLTAKIKCTISYLDANSQPQGSAREGSVHVVHIDAPNFISASAVYGCTQEVELRATTTYYSSTQDIIWTVPSSWALTSNTNTVVTPTLANGFVNFSSTNKYNVPPSKTGDGAGPITVTATNASCPAESKSTANKTITRTAPAAGSINLASFNVCKTIPATVTTTLSSAVCGASYYLVTAPTGFGWYGGAGNVYLTTNTSPLSLTSTTTAVSGNITATAYFPSSCLGCSAVNYSASNTITVSPIAPTAATNISLLRNGTSCFYNALGTGGANVYCYDWSTNNFSTTYASCANPDGLDIPAHGQYVTRYVRTRNACGVSGSISRSLFAATISGCVWKTDEEAPDNTQEQNETAISTTQTADVRLYPNPNQNHVLKIQNGTGIAVDYTLIDVEGRSILSRTIAEAEGEINLQQFSAGIYFIKYNLGTDLKVKKLILQ